MEAVSLGNIEGIENIKSRKQLKDSFLIRSLESFIEWSES